MDRLESFALHLKPQSIKEITYAIPVTPKPKGQTALYRHPQSKDGLLNAPSNIKNLGDFWDSAVDKMSSHKIIDDYTFKQANDMMLKCGSWLKINKVQKLYLYCKSCPEWTLVDLAGWNYGTITIPLYDTLGNQAFDHILRLTEGTVLCTMGIMGDTLIKNLHRCRGAIRKIMIFDSVPLSKPHQKQLQKMGFDVVNFWEDIVNKNQQIVPRPNLNLDSHLTYCFTSGTTGVPKGVITTHRNAISQVLAMKNHYEYSLGGVHMSYLPVAHTFQRFVMWCCIHYGTTIRYSKYPPTEILKDLAIIKPTTIPIVPRLLNKLYPVMRNIYEQGKFSNQAKAKIKGLFGGRLQTMVTGSAPVAPQILTFFREVLQCDVREGYGQTQTTAATFVTYKGDANYGHVGGVNRSAEFKLVDVPQMNYTSQSNPPKGEVCVRGNSIFVGYYKDPKNTNETIDADGFNHSGDIGVIMPGGSLKIIDRKKNIYKLSQGEYVAPEKVENIYMRCKFVGECFIYGDSLRDFNVAVVHPNLDTMPLVTKALGINEKDPKKLCENPKIVKFINDEMNKQAEKDGLFGFEMAKKIKLSHESFVNFGIFTSTMKLQRAVAKKVFLDEIHKLYESK